MYKRTGIAIIILIAFFNKAAKLEGMVRCEGTVTWIERARTGRFGQSYAEVPVVKFEHLGKEYLSRDDIGAKFQNTYKIGDKATVYFPKGYPSLAEVYSLGGYWLSLPFLGILLLTILIWIGICNVLTVPKED